MENQLSNRSSHSSLSLTPESSSLPNLLLSNASAFRTSQSLTSVINTPESSVFDIIYDYFSKSFSFGIEPSAILQDISPEDFDFYLSKIAPFLKARSTQDRQPISPDFTLEKCYAEIPNMFFDPSFKVEDFLDEQSETQHEKISMFLDMTDMSIFSKISVKWQDLMRSAYGLEEIARDVNYLLEEIRQVGVVGKNIQTEVAGKCLAIVRLNRRLGNVKSVDNKLKKISAIVKMQPKIKELINQGKYTTDSQLLAETQETGKSELKGFACLKECWQEINRIKNTLENQLNQEFSVASYTFIVLNTFAHTEQLIKLLKHGSNLESAFKVFPKETNYERMNELIKNKINTATLQSSLQELSRMLPDKIKEECRKMITSLGVYKTDENSKWVNISHPHFIIVLQALISVFNSLFQKFISLSTIVLRQFSSDTGTYVELQKTLSGSVSKSIVLETVSMEKSLTDLFFNKIKSILTEREVNLISGPAIDLKELYELIEKVPLICRNLSISSTNQCSLLVLQIQKKFLAALHERKLAELTTALDGENWMKVDISEETLKFIMEKRGEASKLTGIKLETPENIATGSLLVFYKIVYEYIKISEELQISLECATKLVDVLRFYNSKTYELIVEAKAVPVRLNKVTSKHLALSVQGLTLMLQELPYIEHRLCHKAKELANVISSEINTTRADYASHLKAIYEKLAQIIIMRVNDHCRVALTDAKWDTIISPSQIEKDYYLKLIITDLTSMHSILTTVLNTNQMMEVFSAILHSLAENLVDLYTKVKIDSYIPAQRIKNDTQQLLISLREKFTGGLAEPLEELEEELQKFINEKCESQIKRS
jgi:hypothetical protein